MAGGAVGAGMFALPTVAAGAWTYWSLFGLILVWCFTLLAANLLLDVHLQVQGEIQQDKETLHGPSMSFDTLVRNVLGVNWARINNASLIFIMMILMYAYISAGASIINHTFSQFGHVEKVSPNVLSVLFATAIASLVWVGTTWIARLSSVLMTLMAISLVVVLLDLASSVSWSLLIDPSVGELKFGWGALPVFVTAFACAGLVPTLVRHYQSDRTKVRQSLVGGTLLALIVYVLWIMSTFGVLGQDGFLEVISQGGNTGDLVSALSQRTANDQLGLKLSWFSHCAIITSFVSVGIGLFHFIIDRFGFDNGSLGRFKAVLICFLPPTIGSAVYPKGFLVAIGFAGLFVTLSFFMIPALMKTKRRSLDRTTGVSREVFTAVIVFGFGALIGLIKLLSISSSLPSFTG